MLVQVKIELGHRASVRKALTDDGFTHDWTVFVRGPDGCDIANFIEKVVFNLHHSFVNYKRGMYAVNNDNTTWIPIRSYLVL